MHPFRSRSRTYTFLTTVPECFARKNPRCSRSTPHPAILQSLRRWFPTVVAMERGGPGLAWPRPRRRQTPSTIPFTSLPTNYEKAQGRKALHHPYRLRLTCGSRDSLAEARIRACAPIPDFLLLFADKEEARQRRLLRRTSHGWVVAWARAEWAA